MKKTDMEMYADEVRRLQALKQTRKSIAATLDISLTRLTEIITAIRVEELHTKYLAAREALYNGGGHRRLWDEQQVKFPSQITLTLSEKTQALYAAIKREPHRYYQMYLYEMDFSPRLKNILENNFRWYCLGELLACQTIEELPGMGSKTYAELEAVMNECGLKLKSLDDNWHDEYGHYPSGYAKDIIAHRERLQYPRLSNEALLSALLSDREQLIGSLNDIRDGVPAAVKAMESLRRVVDLARAHVPIRDRGH